MTARSVPFKQAEEALDEISNLAVAVVGVEDIITNAPTSIHTPEVEAGEDIEVVASRATKTITTKVDTTEAVVVDVFSTTQAAKVTMVSC